MAKKIKDDKPKETPRVWVEPKQSNIKWIAQTGVFIDFRKGPVEITQDLYEKNKGRLKKVSAPSKALQPIKEVKNADTDQPV